MNNSDMPAMPLTSGSLAEEIQVEGAAEGVTMTEWVDAQGLSKREHFAAMAMQALITGKVKIDVDEDTIVKTVGQVCAERSINYADALLAALEKQS